jgi:hypothetical protein
MFKHLDKQTIISDFPKIKLSYENITHKKVYNSDMILVIPEGKKCFTWFTYINDKPSCLIMELASDKNIIDIIYIKQVNACFSNDLSYGTILYGTLFYHLGNQFFTIEDIFSYKDELIERKNFGFKIEKIKNILKYDLKQVSYNNSFIVFGLPIICKTNDELENKIKNVKYKINSIQYRLYDRINNYLFISYDNYINQKEIVVINKYVQPQQLQQVQVQPQERIIVKQQLQQQERIIVKQQLQQQERIIVKQQLQPQERILVKQSVKRECVFLIKPDIQTDIYYLYCLDQNLKEEQHSIAHIPDYNTSVMMNKLFRIIKENNNLDALEESDDEEEFENVDITKFVHLDKSYKMVCQFNHKFKKWTPIKLANENSEIIKIFEIKNIYKIYDENKKKQVTKK